MSICFVLFSLNRIFAKQIAHFGIDVHRDVRSQKGDYILSEINEALCSSCNLKPEKFHVQQENMMASMRKRGLPATSLVQGFLRAFDLKMEYTVHAFFVSDSQAFTL